MDSSNYTEKIQFLQEEIKRTNEEITKVWNEFLLLKSGETASEVNLPLLDSRPETTDPLITNFISRAFIHRIYGYPEFDKVLQKSLVSCKLKKNSLEIGHILAVHEVPDTYTFSFDGIKYHTNKKVAIRLSDRSLHFVTFNEISDTLPLPEDLVKFKQACLANEVSLPSNSDARNKELAIKDASTRILTDVEYYQTDVIRNQPFKSIKTTAKEKILCRRIQETANQRGQKKLGISSAKKLKALDKKSEYLASFSKANVQENIQKSIENRLTNKRIEDALKPGPREPKLMDGFTRVPTFATANQKNEMSELAQKKFDEKKKVEEAKRIEAKKTSKGPDLFKIHDFTTGTETRFNPGTDSLQLPDLSTKKDDKSSTPKRKILAIPHRFELEIDPSTIKSLTADSKNKKTTLNKKKRRGPKIND